MSLAGAGRSPQSSPVSRSAPSGAIYSPHKQVADLRRLGVKRHCPLRVQGGARNPLSRSDQRHKAHSIPTISKTKFCASLPSGNPRRQAYPFPNKQTAGLRPTAPAVKRGFAAQPFLDKASRLAPPLPSGNRTLAATLPRSIRKKDYLLSPLVPAKNGTDSRQTALSFCNFLAAAAASRTSSSAKSAPSSSSFSCFL